MAEQKVSVKFGNNSVLITYKKVKYARIKISKNGEILMSVPRIYTQNMALEILERHKIWIEKTLSRISKNSLKDDEIAFFGRIYKLEFDLRAKGVEILEDRVIASSEKALLEFRKNTARELFLRLIDEYKMYVNRAINRVTIRQMSSRWGSCNHKKGYINLNLSLIEKDEKFIRYVVLHELTHLIYPHHRSEFYEFIAKIMPDYKLIKRQ